MINSFLSQFSWYRRLRGGEWFKVINKAAVGCPEYWTKNFHCEFASLYSPSGERLIAVENYDPLAVEKYKAIANSEICAKNLAYSERNKMLSVLANLVINHGLVACIGKDKMELAEEWENVIFLQLPTGQVSFHIHKDELNLFVNIPPCYNTKWDGHSTDQKWERLLEWSKFRRYN